jgi:CelD/BcsL family acetyltransferase involved in cellulose biosynthesis
VTGLDIRVIETDGTLSAAGDAWDALFALSAPQQVFQSRFVLRHWAAHYLGPRARPILVTGWRGERLVMLWPLVMRRRHGLKQLGFMGLPIAQFCDVLLSPRDDPAELLAAGWAAVAGLGADLISLARLRADSNLLKAELPRPAIRHRADLSAYADLPRRAGPDGPSGAYPPRERSNHRRRLRRLAEHGEIVFAEIRPGPEARDLAGAAVRMKRRSLRRHGIVAPTVADPRFDAVFRGLAGDPASPLRISAIRRDGAPIAVDISLDHQQTSFGHVLAVDPDHQRGGVGRILVHHSFANALRRGNTRFDLMPPVHDYKREHADGFVDVADVALPISRKGRLYCALRPWRLRPAVKTALGPLPGPIARRLAAWAHRDEAEPPRL